MYKCARCDKIFEYHSELLRHRKRRIPCRKLAENELANFKCPECDKLFTTRSSLTKHCTEFCPCKKTETKSASNVTQKNDVPIMVSDIEKQYVCDNCGKSFNRKDNHSRHVKQYCKVKPKDNEIELLKKEIDELKLKLSQSDKTPEINVTNNNNIINSNNQTVNIQLVAFGKEDRTRLTNKEILKILNKGFYSVPELLKAIHFDKSKPENHNVYISNDRSNVAHTFDGEQWNSVDRAETIRNLFDDGRNFLLAKAEEFNEIDPPISDRAKKMVLKFERFDNDIDEYPLKKKEIMNAIKNLLYNSKNIPLETQKLIGV